ncbi:MAG: hypothetical protein ACJAUL_003969 [Paraglaciecola sp.]
MFKQRRNFPANADIWHVRFHWNTIRGELLQTLNKQDYTFMPLSVVTKAGGETLHLWSSLDALVLKMLAMALSEALALSLVCTHTTVMSLIQSAKLNDHDPYAYLKDVLERLPTQRASAVNELLPHNWVAAG